MAMSKKKAVALARELHGLSQEMYACYTNDVQPDRATAMEKIALKIERVAEPLQHEPMEPLHA